MTGTPYRLFHALAAGLPFLLAGCAVERAETASPMVGPEWVAEDIAGAGPVAGSRVTLRLGADNRASGSTGCNSYSGPYTYNDEVLRIGMLVSTRRGCEPALMAQEQRFLGALSAVSRHSLREDGALVLTAPDGRSLRFRGAGE
jgi:putative lipoprotein